MREVQLKSSEKLKIIQAMSGVTQEVLAQRFGVSFVTLNSWINGRSEPRKRKSVEIDEYYCEFTGQSVVAEEKLHAYYEYLLVRRDQILELHLLGSSVVTANWVKFLFLSTMNGFEFCS
jgi:transcriptional regulator with XRE-family HTH domain